MNAAAIVDILLEGDMTPEEFLQNSPEVLVHYEFAPHPLRSHEYEVKRWLNGSYSYIGTVRHAEKLDQWYAYEVAGRLPRGGSIHHFQNRASREEAAADLWALYRARLGVRESEAAEFVHGLPPETWDTFLVAADGEDSVHAPEGYRQHHLVYKNNENGTRDFIGFIVQASNHRWYPSGVLRPRTSRNSGTVDKLSQVKSFKDQQEAARYLMAVYRLRNSKDWTGQ